MKATAILLLVVAVASAGLTVMYYFQYTDAQRFVEGEYNKAQRICQEASAKEGTPGGEALAGQCREATKTLGYRSSMIEQPKGYFLTSAIISGVSFCLASVLLFLARRKKAGLPEMEAAR